MPKIALSYNVFMTIAVLGLKGILTCIFGNLSREDGWIANLSRMNPFLMVLIAVIVLLVVVYLYLIVISSLWNHVVSPITGFETVYLS